MRRTPSPAVPTVTQRIQSLIYSSLLECATTERDTPRRLIILTHEYVCRLVADKHHYHYVATPTLSVPPRRHISDANTLLPRIENINLSPHHHMPSRSSPPSLSRRTCRRRAIAEPGAITPDAADTPYSASPKAAKRHYTAYRPNTRKHITTRHIMLRHRHHSRPRATHAAITHYHIFRNRRAACQHSRRHDASRHQYFHDKPDMTRGRHAFTKNQPLPPLMFTRVIRACRICAVHSRHYRRAAE